MTQEEFKKTSFGNGDSAKYKNKIYQIAQVDFEEMLIGMLMNIPGGDWTEISWVRCENIEFIPKPIHP